MNQYRTFVSKNKIFQVTKGKIFALLFFIVNDGHLGSLTFGMDYLTIRCHKYGFDHGSMSGPGIDGAIFIMSYLNPASTN